jgi:AraC-like DNA-binding protein
MIGEASVRYWQPAREAATDLVAAYLKDGTQLPHLHEEWQLGVLDAPSRLSVGAFRRHGVELDDVTILAPFEVHSERGVEGAVARWSMLYVAPSMMSRLHGDGPRPRGPVIADPAAAAELRELLRESADESIDGSRLLTRVAGWLEGFLRRHAEAAVKVRKTPPIERVRAYLQDHPTEPVSLAELEAIAGVSQSRLIHSFSSEVGLPPRSYHAQVRLARARRLLAEGKAAGRVAYECGFADQSHLSRRFKQCHGLTPGAFQAQYLARGAAVAA